MDERERVQTDEAKGPPEEDPRIAGEKHPVARMIGIGVFASLIGIAITLLIDWFPADASTAATDIDTVYDVLLICSVPVFVLVMTIAIYSVVRFRAKPGDMGDGAPIHGNTRLEVIWVTIPFLMVSALAAYGWIVLDDIEAKKPNEMVVRVIGQQFTWNFEYPGERVS
ncbi:MAG: cytochrome c oxidase subunit II transmembrane domain-containing protein, partial [Burkholderiales bacterium]